MQNVTYPDGESVAYVYDHGGNLESAASAARTYVSNIHYDHFGRRTRVRNGNGTETVYTFDAVMQRLSQTDTTTDSGATALQALRYTYNSVGLISRIQNVIAPGPMRGSSDHNFTYDEHEQLVTATGSFHHDSGDERRYSLTMDYDSIGRTTKMKQTDELLASGGGVTTVTETTRNNTYAYAGPRVHAASQVGGNEYWYDNNGNQAWRYNASSGDWRALSWDDEDRLVGAFVPGTSEYFNYDAGGARTHKTDYTETTLYPSAFVTIRNGGEVTKHVWAGGERVGSVVRPDGGGVGDERAYWTHNDHLGGGHYVTTSVGAVYEMAERLPFGENWVSARAGTDRVAPGFAGGEHDESIGLNYHGARYYDAKEARWTGRDPALEGNVASGGVFDPRNLELYAYAFNSPVSYSDPDGRQSVPTGPRPNASAQPAAVDPVLVGPWPTVYNPHNPPDPRELPEPGVIIRGNPRRGARPRPEYRSLNSSPGAPSSTPAQPALSAQEAGRRLGLVRLGIRAARLQGLTQAADWLEWWIHPANQGEAVVHNTRAFASDSSNQAVQDAVDQVVANARSMRAQGQLSGTSTEVRGSQMITPLGGPANSTRERDVSISLGTYSVAVHADVRLGRSGEILLSNWRAQFFDFYDFNIGASAPISFPASSLNSVERVVINAVVRNAMPGNPGLVPQYSGRRLTGYTISLPDAYFAALANSGYAHNYPVRSTVFSPRDTPGVVAPAFVR